MKLSNVQYFCDTQREIFNIPLKLMHGEKTLTVCFPFEKDVPGFEKIFDELGLLPERMNYKISKGFLQFGIVKGIDEDAALLMGPALRIPLSETELNNTAISMGVAEADRPAFCTYLSGLPILSNKQFGTLIRLFYLVMNDEPIDLAPFDAHAQRQERMVNENVAALAESITYGEHAEHANYKVESTLLYYISNGMVDELRKLNLVNHLDQIGRTAREDIRHMQNIVLILNSLSSRAAIKGGMPAEAAYSLAEVYAQKIEMTNSFEALQWLSNRLRIDYAQQVRDLKYKDINDLTIVRAVKYIVGHVTEKLSTAMIADALSVTKEYLSAKFKEVMKMTVTDFIQKEKVRQAKYLLVYSKDSLVQITNYLSFSSQSYFQSIFKKHTGMTPSEYRARNNLD